VILLRRSLNGNESTANRLLSTKLLMKTRSEFPLTLVITFFSLVVISLSTSSLLIFLRPFSSASISRSSFWVSNLNLISIFDFGSVQLNSFTPFSRPSKLTSFSTNRVRSTLSLLCSPQAGQSTSKL
jgi:hypothetical protein